MISREILQKKFRVFIFLSSLVLLLEVAGGVFTNSLALLSDAGHVLIDLLALLLAYFALQLSRKASTGKFTFGYYRAEILSAVVNGLVLIFITMFIFYQAYLRFLSPEPVKGPEMLIISVAGLMANLYVVIKMQDYERGNLNMRGAYLHVLTDTLSSVGVVVAGVLIFITGNYIFDPLISVIIGIFILFSSLRLIRESANILMEAVPAGVDLNKLTKDMAKIKGVKEVHDLHVWCISSDVYALNSHVLIDANDVKSLNNIVSRINEMLKTKYKITHTTIQSECGCCVDDKNKHSH
ncbi:MAG: cation diffusion facilitator family transporter [Candidatus Aenigmarchaeota archaeon]|nr:cation diffusion facilitator family transporter [Candidatus Aenigmarchaeota archaeon]